MAISGTIVKPGDIVNVTYSGGIQQWVVPMDGLYKLEVWGAKGGTAAGPSYTGAGGNGGYSIGYKELKTGTILYVVTGGMGGNATKGADQGGAAGAGGYNGGGAGHQSSDSSARVVVAGGGGGATHISTRTGLLSELKSYLSSVLIVAGGGGGGATTGGTTGPSVASGGAGGGTTGGNQRINNYSNTIETANTGGTQSTGYAFGLAQSGQTGNSWGTGGGGGGLYGGYAKDSPYSNYASNSGGGGSGYIGGVPQIIFNDITYSPATSAGIWTNNGKAIITLVAAPEPEPELYLGNYGLDMFLEGMQTNLVIGKQSI